MKTISPPNKRYNHQKGCGTVAKVMKERFSNDFALGIVDKDKKDIEYLKEFETVCTKSKLLLHKHRNRNHFIIQISPAIERFILEAVELANLSVTDYGLPNNLESLKKIAKSINSKDDIRFKTVQRH